MVWAVIFGTVIVLSLYVVLDITIPGLQKKRRLRAGDMAKTHEDE